MKPQYFSGSRLKGATMMLWSIPRESLSSSLTSRVGGLTMRRAYEYAPRSHQDAHFPSVQQRVADYFDAQETINFYRDFWDREHYHFGYYQRGMNPLDLASMTDAMTH